MIFMTASNINTDVIEISIVYRIDCSLMFRSLKGSSIARITLDPIISIMMKNS
jgi:hypothetical protein